MTDVRTARETWEAAAHADLAYLAAREADAQTSVADATVVLAEAHKHRAKARAAVLAAREADAQTSVADATVVLAEAHKHRAKARAAVRAARREYERKGLELPEAQPWADGTTEGDHDNAGT